MEAKSEDAIRKELENLTAVNESYKQQIHVLKMRLDSVQTMEQEAVLHVEAIQAELVEEQARYAQLLAQHNKDAAFLNRQWMEKLKAVEENFLEEKTMYEDKIKKQKEKIAELENVSLMDSSEIIVDLQKLKNKNQELVELIQIHEVKLSKEKQLNDGLESLVQELSRELEVAKSNCEQKKEELASVQEMRDNIQGEATQLKLELERMKAEDPSQVKRGNSLFAEVEDRRKLLQGHLDSTRAKMHKLKMLLKNKDTEISKLRADKSHLCFQFRTLEKDCKLMDTQWHDAYTQRIQELEMIVRELRGERKVGQPLSARPGGGGAGGLDDFKWVELLLEQKQAEVRRLEAALEEKSVACLMSANCTHQARRDLQATRAQLLAANATILDLKMALLAANPGFDIDCEDACGSTESSLQPACEESQSSGKENVTSANMQKFPLAEHNLRKELSCASFGTVVQCASKSERSEITATVVDVNTDEINFPVI